MLVMRVKIFKGVEMFMRMGNKWFEGDIEDKEEGWFYFLVLSMGGIIFI